MTHVTHEQACDQDGQDGEGPWRSGRYRVESYYVVFTEAMNGHDGFLTETGQVGELVRELLGG